MKTTITFRHMKASSAIKDFVQERLDRLARYSRKSLEAHVILSVDKKTLQNAEVLISAKGIRALANATTQDLYSSIDTAVDKVEKTLRKLHDRKVRQKNRSAKPQLAL